MSVTKLFLGRFCSMLNCHEAEFVGSKYPFLKLWHQNVQVRGIWQCKEL